MEFKFDKIDKKLISYLYHHYREPLTKIAKACRISRDQVEYRLKKYELQGLIKKYATIFNYKLLGYDEFIIVWLKLEATKEQKESLRKEFQKNKNVITFLNVIGKYDLVTDLVYKNKEEFEKEFGEFLEKYKTIIKDYSIFMTTSATFFPLKEFGLLQSEKEFVLGDSGIKRKLDSKEIKILKALEKNGRAKIIDIAEQTELSAELVLYKLKQLHKKRIVLGTRIIFDLEKMGYFLGILKLKIKHLSEKTKQEIFDFCKQHKFINALSFGIGEHNCFIQIFYKQEKQFRDSLKEFLEKFQNEIHESEIILIENEGEVKTLVL